MRQHAVNIAGGGLAGALLAVLLGRRGIPVNVFERRADPRVHAADAGRSINLALAARGIRALERANLMEQVRPVMLPMRGRMIHEPQPNSPPRLLRYGQRASEVIYSIGRAALNRVLIEAAAGLPQVRLHFDTTCTDVDVANGSLRAVDNRTGMQRTIEAAAIIATDGAGSAVRSSLARAGRVSVTELPLEHDYKEFHIPPQHGQYALHAQALHVWPRHGFMLIALPNPDRSFTATLFLPHTGRPGFDTLDSGAAAQELFEREFASAAALIPDLPAQFREHPAGRLGTIHTEPWACGSILLLGDAAHAIVPFHGQGMNAAFEDCVLLDALLADDGTHCDWPTIFAGFSAARRPDTEAIAQMALENYSEMRSAVLDARFLRQKSWALQLERRYPTRFIPRYAMVMFHPEISYAEALRRGAVQQQILDALDAQRAHHGSADSAQLDEAELARAQQLIAAQL
ncbi:MAG TPA: NAD(P)/FAD-dependent oxidoreductase [Steroidobacteraceae bacterium]|jgi:kynurenine 3-monooxygenase|nr:NAD(P)/FAD-dependent oxidoreductase [Steroidobacteraceae bacterium]